MPSKTPFVIHAWLTDHMTRTDGYYPHGGASEIAFQIIPGIERVGGAVLAQGRVGEIMYEKGTVCGE